MKKWIAAAVVVVIVIAAAVWYKVGSAPAVAETPETAATPAPAATPVPTPAATPTATPESAPPTATPANTEETEEVVDKDSPEYIKKEYSQEGQIISDEMKSQGIYMDEDGVIRWPDGDPVTFDDPNSYPEGSVSIDSPDDVPNLMTEEEQQATKDANDGKNPELNAVIDQLYKEGYFN